MNILHIDSSPRDGGDTRFLTQAIVEALCATSPHARITRRDVAHDPPPPITEAWLAHVYGVRPAAKTDGLDAVPLRAPQAAARNGASDAGPANAEAVVAEQEVLLTERQAADADAVVGELEDADVVVLGVPMYNFAVPSTLKAWIDLVVRSGRTFTFRDGAAVGLLADRPVYVVMSSGADYEGDGPLAPFDFVTPYLRHVLGFMGLGDVRFVRHVHHHDPAQNRQRLSRAAEALQQQVTDERAVPS